MPVSAVRKRFESFFLHVEDVPDSADFASGEYADGSFICSSRRPL